MSEQNIYNYDWKKYAIMVKNGHHNEKKLKKPWVIKNPMGFFKPVWGFIKNKYQKFIER